MYPACTTQSSFVAPCPYRTAGGAHLYAINNGIITCNKCYTNTTGNTANPVTIQHM